MYLCVPHILMCPENQSYFRGVVSFREVKLYLALQRKEELGAAQVCNGVSNAARSNHWDQMTSLCHNSACVLVCIAGWMVVWIWRRPTRLHHVWVCVDLIVALQVESH